MVCLLGIRRRFVVLTVAPGVRRQRYHAVFAAELARRSPPLAFRRPPRRITLADLLRSAAPEM